jgi:hypothetical protein
VIGARAVSAKPSSQRGTTSPAPITQFGMRRRTANVASAASPVSAWSSTTPMIPDDTGRVRGLLCQNCNKGVGLLGDAVEGVQHALNYMHRAETRNAAA